MSESSQNSAPGSCRDLADLGPFEDARSAAAASTWAKSHRPAGAMMQMNLQDLERACTCAGLDLTQFERNIVAWFSAFEPSSVMVFVSLIGRAHAGGWAAAMKAAGEDGQ